MPQPFPAEFRLRAVALVRAGKPITTAAVQLGLSAAVLHNWARQDQIDRGERPGITTSETAELSKAKKRIRQARKRSRNTKDRREAPRGESSRSKRIHSGIDRLIEAGYRAKLCCRFLGVSSPGYYRNKNRALSPTQIFRLLLTGLINEVHIASRQTYGSRRIHAELTIGMKLKVSERLVAVLMSGAGIRGLPGPANVERLHGIATADGLVHRKFHRLSPNELWITDISPTGGSSWGAPAEHPTKEGKIYGCAVMDTFS